MRAKVPEGVPLLSYYTRVFGEYLKNHASEGAEPLGWLQ
jgi:hypothetical protein